MSLLKLSGYKKMVNGDLNIEEARFMKLILSVLATIAVALSLTACNFSDPDPNDSLSIEAERIDDVGEDAAAEYKEKEGEY
jgi:hypothetical protein